MNHRPYPNRDDANRAARENEIEQDRREHVARCADTPTAGSVTATSTTPDGLIMYAQEHVGLVVSAAEHNMIVSRMTAENLELVTLAANAEFSRSKAERELATEKAMNQRNCEDWASDHTHLQKLCREAGFTEHDVEGDKYGIRAITQLADLLHSKAAVLGMEKASLAAEMHNLERKNARLEGLLIKLVEAGEKLRKELVIECQKLGDGPREIDEWDAAAKAKEAQP